MAAEGAEAQGEHDRRSSRAADERWGGAEGSEKRLERIPVFWFKAHLPPLPFK